MEDIRACIREMLVDKKGGGNKCKEQEEAKGNSRVGEFSVVN